MVTVRTSVQLEVEECYRCSTLFGLPVQFKKNRRRDHSTFYCPNGHGQHYTGKSEEEKLRDRLAQAEEDANAAVTGRINAERMQREAEKRTSKLLKRIERGVCPHCHRSFQNVRRHVANKHSDGSDA